MDRKLKEALKMGFAAPPPKGKAAFLDRLDAPKLSYRAFFWGQVGYIRKRIWGFSTGVTVIGVALLGWEEIPLFLGAEGLWILSALVPFLALLTVMELSRSSAFGMAELELSCRYRLPQIVMVRAAILGSANGILLTGLAVVVGIVVGEGFLMAILAIFFPYLLTCALSIYALNRVGAAESIFCCGGIACGVSAGENILRVTNQFLFTEGYLWVWGGLCLLTLLLLFVQGKHYIVETEEFKWSLSLID